MDVLEVKKNDHSVWMETEYGYNQDICGCIDVKYVLF